MKKVLVTAALAAGLIGSLWSLATPGPQLRDNFNIFVFSERRTADSATAPAAVADTIAGPRVRCDFSRRIIFRVSNAHMMTKAVLPGTPNVQDQATLAQACSLATIQVTNYDSSNADERAGPYLTWEDANGKAGVSIIDNLSSASFGESLGYRTIEMAAPGSGRIPFRWARCVIRLKSGGAAYIYGLKMASTTTDD